MVICEIQVTNLGRLEKYPSWPKGLPWKGSRSLIAARGFKSLLLRFFQKKERKKFLTKQKRYDKIEKLLKRTGVEKVLKKLKKVLDKLKTT